MRARWKSSVSLGSKGLYVPSASSRLLIKQHYSTSNETSENYHFDIFLLAAHLISEAGSLRRSLVATWAVDESAVVSESSVVIESAVVKVVESPLVSESALVRESAVMSESVLVKLLSLLSDYS